MAEHASTTKTGFPSGCLAWIERIGNRLPDPATLFLIGTVLVMIASAAAAKTQWIVEERLPEQAAALGQADDPQAKAKAKLAFDVAKRVFTWACQSCHWSKSRSRRVTRRP